VGCACARRSKICGEALATARSDVDRARSGVVEAIGGNYNAGPGRNDAIDLGLPVTAQHAPILLRMKNDWIAVLRLNVPREKVGGTTRTGESARSLRVQSLTTAASCASSWNNSGHFGQSAIRLFEQVKRGQTRHWKNG
jgi:hypothetical protein